jgi:hypothetical protein
MKEPEKRPDCFGDLNHVFPRRSDGLRVTPVGCLQCCEKTLCLRTAMGQEHGSTVREEMLERAYRSGMIGFFQRWSRKKSLNSRKSKTSKR